MRLDHLLSKEHSFRGAQRCRPRRRPSVGPKRTSWGDDASEQWKRRLVGTWHPATRQYVTAVQFRCGEWNLDVDGGRAPGTLLGPEGSGAGPLSWAADQAIPGRGAARSLRTAQWTRASLWRQATKGTRWKPWHQEPMKVVGACDKPRGVGNRALIRGLPNGETQLESCPATGA